jgi:hypothetical protein
MDTELYELLTALDGVRQDRRYHPEGDALFHSLQVFLHARRDTDDPELLAAALLHDVGKAWDDGDHALSGACLLDGLVSDRVIWLVEHHLDLLRHPRRTRALLLGTPQLRDLERLRGWDLAGRDPRAHMPSIEWALSHLTLTPACGGERNDLEP